MRGALVFNTRLRKIGWNSGPKYRKNSLNSESIVMNSFTQGLEIFLQQLRSLDRENRPRVDQSNLDRIERLKIALAEYLRSETTAGTSSLLRQAYAAAAPEDVPDPELRARHNEAAAARSSVTVEH